MAKIRKIYHTDFTVVATALYRDKNLSLKDRGLLGTMLSLPEDWNFSIKGLAAIVSDGESSIRASLQRLEELNYLRRVKITEKGKILDWEYIFSDHPMSDDELPPSNVKSKEPTNKKPHVENQQVESRLSPDVDFPQLENPLVDNRAQLNIKEENKIYDIEIDFDVFINDVCTIFDTSKSRLTKKQRGIIRSWFERHIDIKLINLAHDEAWNTFDMGKKNFNYINGILNNWLLEGKTAADFSFNRIISKEDDLMLNSIFNVPEYEK